MPARPVPVIILQYGKFELTQACIESVRAQTIPVEVVLVDGNSPGKTPEILAELAKLADQHIFLETNLGYAGANNVAIQKVLTNNASYFFVLNNDTLLPSDCMENLTAFMESHPRAAEVCPAVQYPDGTLQAAGGTIRQDLFEPQLIGHGTRVEDYSQPTLVKYAPGMAVLVRSAAVAKAGTIPEEYFMYAEDVDWSLQFTKAGYEIWYCPEARITHYDSASMGSFHQKKGFYMTRANVWLAKKWLSESEYAEFLRRLFWKLVRQSVKYANHPGFVKGMWQGYREGKA